MSLEETPGYGCDGTGEEGTICDCLGCAVERIASATESIARTLADQAEGACKNIDQCIDKILEGIKKKVEGPVYSCEECKAMIERGMGGTLEYAVRCAAATCNECQNKCSSEGEPINEGKCCDTCGSVNCTCVDGSCVSVSEEEEDEKRKYVAWCHLEEGFIAVTRQGDPPPGSGFSQVGLTDTEQAAVELAKANCGAGTDDELNNEPIPEAIGGSQTCNLDDYFNGKATDRLNVLSTYASLEAGTAQAASAIGSVGLAGVNLNNIGAVIEGVWNSWVGWDANAGREMVPNLAIALSCDSPQFTGPFKALSAINRVSNFVGVDASDYTTGYQYAMNAACRRKLLTPGDAMASYIANGITSEELDKLFAIHGICHDPVIQMVQTAKSKLIATELSIARRRRLISPDRYAMGMRELGYIDETVPETIFKLSEQVPTPQELIRYMVRDAGNADVVGTFGLDTGFTDNYSGEIKDWSDFQGVTEKQMQYNWRAHWSIPSPTALFTFWQRLRYNPKFGGKDKMEADIKKALIQQDILPYWHEHYLAINFNRMRLVDIRRSFQIGSLTQDELVPQYLDNGYSDDTAQKMAEFTIRLRDIGVQSSREVKQWVSGQITKADATVSLQKNGVPMDVINKAFMAVEPNFNKSVYAAAFVRGDISRQGLIDALTAQGVSSTAIDKIAEVLSFKIRVNPVMDDYEIGTINRSEASSRMTSDGMNPSIVTRTLDKIDKHVHNQSLKQCIAGIKRRYLLGEIERVDAQNELVGRGVIVPRANQMVDWWNCELKAGEKQVSAAMLCEWLQRGAINSSAFLERLGRIGYSSADAALMLEDCLILMNVRAQTKAKREAAESAAEQQRVSRILTQAAKQEASYLQRLEANRKKAAKLRASREKSLLTTAVAIAGKCECGIFEAKQLAGGESTRIQTEYGLSIDRSLQIIALAVKEWDGLSPDSYGSTVTALAETAASSAIDGVEEQLPPVTSSSGAT